MIPDSQSVAALRRAIDDISAISSELAVILIMRRRGVTPDRGDYERFSLSASLYESYEVDDLITAFRSSGVYVQYFEDELEFIEWHRAGGYQRLPRRYKLVYSFATSGRGPGRRTLIPAYCARESIPTVNSDTYGSVIGRHKFHCNRLLQSLGIDVPRSWYFDEQSGWFANDVPPQGTQVIGKATYEDGSIGLTDATVGPYDETLHAALAEMSASLQQPITIQEFIAGDELEVPVVHFERALVPAPLLLLNASGERFTRDVLTYEASWEDAFAYTLPDALARETIGAAATAASAASTALEHRGFARIDFRVGSDGRPLVTDTAAYPHLTKSNAFAYLFQEIGFSYEAMLLALLATGAKRWQFV